MTNDFSDLTFRDKEKAKRHLDSLFQSNRPQLSKHLRLALTEAANADRVLVRLMRYLEAAEDREIQLDMMAKALDYTRLLCTLFDHSQFLTDIVCANPEFMTWLWVEREADPEWRRESLLPELRGRVIETHVFAEKCAIMRRFVRRELLRIGMRDVFAHSSVPEVTVDLSNLADAILQVALESAEAELEGKYGKPRTEDDAEKEAEFSVVAMGKLGGRELNFSSDIDLIFVYSHEGETSGTSVKKISNAEYFAKLGELLIKALTEKTAEGHIFRVDMRLRPYGRVGPLATSLSSCLDYYEMQGRPWERQALVKARPAAGSIGLGQAFIELTRPFVYRRFFDDDTLNDIRETKLQMENKVALQGQTETEVKLGRGGIRDIEFTVQMLQLLNGGRNAELRTPNTLDAIDILGRINLLTSFEALTLSRNYLFLRMVEHRIQIEGSRQQHALPSDPEALNDLARRLGYKSGEAFMVGYRDRSDETRDILERFFATEGSGNLWVMELLNRSSEAQVELARLGEMGFQRAPQAREELLSLYEGPKERPHTAHVRQLFATVAPIIIEALTGAPNPDDSLLRLGKLLKNLNAPSAIYDIIKERPGLCESLVTLVSASRYLADFIIRDPGLFETFGHADVLESEINGETLDEELRLLQGAYDERVALYRLRDAQTLRIGMRELLGHVQVAAVGRELTVLAETCLGAAFHEAQAKAAHRYGPAGRPFTVLGLGKMGGAEMGYGSDLDLVFVHGSKGPMPPDVGVEQYFASIAAGVIKTLMEPTSHGRLYEVDVRLRPEGSHGTLTISEEALAQYCSHRARPWERLALVKCRPVAGDLAFGAKVVAQIQDWAFHSPLTAEDLSEIESVRRRLADAAGPLDLKRAEGGTAEIEFLIRLLQIRYAPETPDLRRGDVLGALSVLRESSHMSQEDAAQLENAYLFLRRVENRIRMREGRSGSSLPADPMVQKELASQLGLEEDLVSSVNTKKTAVHALYQRYLALMKDEVAAV